MTSISKLGTAGILSAAILLLGTGNRCYTQATVPPPPVDEHLIVSTVPSPAVTPVTVTADQPGTAAAPDPSPSGSPQAGMSRSARICGSREYMEPLERSARDVSVQCTPGDLLSNFRFRLMGLVAVNTSLGV